MLGSLPSLDIDRVSGIVCLDLGLEAHWLAAFLLCFVAGEGLLVFGHDFDLCCDGVGKRGLVPGIEKAVELMSLLVNDSSSHDIDDKR